MTSSTSHSWVHLGGLPLASEDLRAGEQSGTCAAIEKMVGGPSSLRAITENSGHRAFTTPTCPSIHGTQSSVNTVLVRVKRARNKVTGEERILAAVPTGVVNKKVDFAHPLQPNSRILGQSNTLALPPQLFVNTKNGYFFKDGPMASHWSWEATTDGEQRATMSLTSATTVRSIVCGSGDPTPTQRSEEQEHFVMNMMNESEIAAIADILDAQPVWVAETLIHSKFSARPSKRWLIMRCFTYIFRGGPFDRLAIRLGYDPRNDASAWRYQRIKFRFPKPIVSQISELAAIPNIAGRLAAAALPDGFSSSKHRIFSRIVIKERRQQSIVIADMDDADFFKIVEESHAAVDPVFHHVTGWLSDATMKRLMAYFHEEFAHWMRIVAVVAARANHGDEEEELHTPEEASLAASSVDSDSNESEEGEESSDSD